MGRVNFFPGVSAACPSHLKGLTAGAFPAGTYFYIDCRSCLHFREYPFARYQASEWFRRLTVAELLERLTPCPDCGQVNYAVTLRGPNVMPSSCPALAVQDP